eukprot:1159080-Pelagomonas_calceolata.AAC.2
MEALRKRTARGLSLPISSLSNGGLMCESFPGVTLMDLATSSSSANETVRLRLLLAAPAGCLEACSRPDASGTQLLIALKLALA